MVERKHGMVQSGGSVFIYSADIRKPIYLTLFLQNGWILEKVLYLFSLRNMLDVKVMVHGIIVYLEFCTTCI